MKTISAFLLALVVGTFVVPQISSAQIVESGTPLSSCVYLTHIPLTSGSRDATTEGEVSILQDFLMDKGLLIPPVGTPEGYYPTGYYGLKTVAAVKAYQASKGISQVGFVGPATKTAIAADTGCNGTTPVTCSATSYSTSCLPPTVDCTTNPTDPSCNTLYYCNGTVSHQPCVTTPICNSVQTLVNGVCVNITMPYTCPNGTVVQVGLGVPPELYNQMYCMTTANVPVISSLSPSSGPVGSTFTIYGSGFAATGNQVYMDYSSSVSSWRTFGTYSSPNGTSIIVTVPTDSGCPIYRSGGVGCAVPQALSLGVHTVTVNSSAGTNLAPDTSRVSNTVSFNVTASTVTCPTGQTLVSGVCTATIGVTQVIFTSGFTASSNTTQANAMTYCMTIKANNGGQSVRCTWNGTEIYNDITTPSVPTITTTSLPNATTGTYYSGTVVSTGGTASNPITWNTVGTLPPGLTKGVTSLSCPIPSVTGTVLPCVQPQMTLTGTPTTAGTYTFTAQATFGGQTISKQFTIVVSPAVATTYTGYINLNTTTCSIPAGNSTCTVNLTWGVNNYSSAETLILQNNTTTITRSTLGPVGTNYPVYITPGTHNFVLKHNNSTVATSANVTATCASGSSWNGTSCLTVTTTPPTITTLSLPNATVGVEYGNTNVEIVSSGGTGTRFWSLSGNVPPGIHLNPVICSVGINGDVCGQPSTIPLAGVPTTAGTYTFTATVTTGTQTASKQFTIVVNPSAVITAPSINLTSPSASTNITIGNAIPIRWSYAGATANQQVVYGVNLIAPSASTGSIGGGTGQTTALAIGAGTGQFDWTTGSTGRLNIPGTYEITAKIVPCSTSGCSYSASGNALSTAPPVRITMVSPSEPTGITQVTFVSGASASSNTTQANAMTYCMTIKSNNGGQAVRCTWNGTEIYNDLTSSVAPTITFSPDTTTTFGGTTTLTWKVSPSTDVTCAAAGGNLAAGMTIGTSGTWITPSLYTTTQYGITCINNLNGLRSYKYSTVTVPNQTSNTSAPVITMTPDLTVPFGGTAALSWNVSPTTNVTCAAAGGSVTPGTITGTTGYWMTPPLYTTTTYGVGCKDNSTGLTSYKYTKVTVLEQATAPTITLTTSSSTVHFGGKATLTWNTVPSTNVTCGAAGGGLAAGVAIQPSGSWETPALYATTQYGIGCTNNSNGLKSYKYATVNVQAQTSQASAPVVTATGEGPISFGGTATIRWSVTPSTNVSCVAAGGEIPSGTPIATSGTWTSSKLYTTTQYVIRCTDNSTNLAGYKYITVTVPTQGNVDGTSSFAVGSSGYVLGASVSCIDLTTNMHRGYETKSVTKLQGFLQSKGFLMDAPTGFYGDKTVAAVKAYQKSQGLPMTGMVYGMTRSAIRAESCQQ